MTVANLERIYPIKVYKKCRNVGEHLVIGPFSLIFIEIVLGILGVRLIYQCISSFVPVFFCLLSSTYKCNFLGADNKQ